MEDYDVIVAEEVWGEPFDRLTHERSVLAVTDLWSSRTRLIALLGTARALVVRNRTTVDAELIRSAPNLKIIARAGVGLENIDLREADEHGVVVASPHGANSRSVAEYTIGAALTLMRDLVNHDRAVRAGQWDRHMGRELSGRTWGILGAGSTGLAVARLAREFGMTVIGYDPHVDDEPRLVAAGVHLTTLDALCREADVVSVHLPGGTETAGLVDRRLIKLMGGQTILINVGRGEIVDEEALRETLESGDLAGAALDVRVIEPPVLGALERLDNTLMTPHIAGITEESQERIVHSLVDDIRGVLAGETATHAVGRVQKAETGGPATDSGVR